MHLRRPPRFLILRLFEYFDHLAIAADLVANAQKLKLVRKSETHKRLNVVLTEINFT
jgi:hypothetical protein